MKVRSYLVILILAALLPVVTFATIAVARLARYERETAEQGMRETARALSLAVDRELASARATLLLLVTSPHLRSGDLDAFHRQCVDALSLRGTWIMLSEPSGRQLLNTLRPPGTPLPQRQESDVLRRVAATGQLAVSDLVHGNGSERPIVTVNVPVFEGRRVRYVLSMAVLPEALNAILLEQKLPLEVIGTIYDRHGVAIARTLDPAKFVGTSAPAPLIAAMSSGPEGWVRDKEVEGRPAYFAFSRSKLSGWTVSLDETAATFDETLWRSLWAVGGAGVLAILLAIGMATIVGARISRSISSLSAAAPAVLAGDRRFEVPSSPLREIDELAAALEGARETMRRQSHERERLLAEAEEAVRRRAESLALVDTLMANAPVGLAFMDRDLRFAHVNESFAMQTQLIEDLLDVSRIISGKLQLDRLPVELAAVIEAAAQSLRSVADSKGVALRIALDASGGIVDGDPHRLQQVVLNLLSNAIKFTPPGGHIDVRLECADERAHIVVSDTGQGISAEMLPHVFDRFRQADSTHTKQHGGLGLGLAIVRHLVALHGGTARADSEGPGRGATFTIELPLAASLERGEASRRPAAPAKDARSIFDCPPVLEGVRIMVVDDEPDARRFVARVFEECKADVTAVGSAAEALAALPRVRPQVLVSDIGMPRTDGYELLRTLRKRDPEDGGQIPALALTAYASAEDRGRAMAAGYQRHLAKPVDPADLVDAVVELADRAAAIDGVRTITG